MNNDETVIERQWNEFDNIYVSPNFIVFSTAPKEILFWVPRNQIGEDAAHKILEWINMCYPVDIIELNDWI